MSNQNTEIEEPVSPINMLMILGAMLMLLSFTTTFAINHFAETSSDVTTAFITGGVMLAAGIAFLTIGLRQKRRT